MKTKVISLIILFAFTAIQAFSQSTVKKEVQYSYTEYPWVKFDKKTTSYSIETQFSDEFLSGDLQIDNDKYTNTKTYTFKPKAAIFISPEVKELKFATGSSLKIVVKYKAKFSQSLFIQDYERRSETMANSKIPPIGRNKEKLITAEVYIYENATLLDSRNFDWEIDYKSEYLDYHKHVTKKKEYEPGDAKIKFSDENARAMFMIGQDLRFTTNDIIKYVDEKLGTHIVTIPITLYSAKSKDADYSEIDAILNQAMGAIGLRDKAGIKKSIDDWKKYIAQADFNNKKAKYNGDVTAMLYLNCIHGYFIIEDFKAYKELKQKIESDMGFLGKTWKDEFDEAFAMMDKLERNRTLNIDRF